MKILYYSTQFKKDLKRYRNESKKMEKLYSVLQMLENEEELPPELKAHRLTGDYKYCLECHIEGDFLLIWYDDESDIIDLLRLGSHSELFK